MGTREAVDEDNRGRKISFAVAGGAGCSVADDVAQSVVNDLSNVLGFQGLALLHLVVEVFVGKATESLSVGFGFGDSEELAEVVADGEVGNVCEVLDETGTEGAFAYSRDAEDVDDGGPLWFPDLTSRVGGMAGRVWC